MENIKGEYIPVGQASKSSWKIIKGFVKLNKLKLIISISTICLLCIYIVLITNFINLIQLLNN